jgi:hypothetical protein
MDVSSGLANLDRVMRLLGLFASASSERIATPWRESWVSDPHLCPIQRSPQPFSSVAPIDESGRAVR